MAFEELKKMFDENAASGDSKKITYFWFLAAAEFDKTDDLQFAKYLIEENMLEAKDKYGRTPLSFLQGTADSKFVKFLVDSGADVNAVAFPGEEDESDETSELFARNRYLTPLRAAAEAGDCKSVKILFDAGADIEACGGMFWTSPLATAAMNNDCAMINLLLDLGADINVSHWGEIPGTALTYALENNSVEAVNLLLERGADATIEDGFGHSPEMVAALYCDLKLAEKIKEVADAQRCEAVNSQSRCEKYDASKKEARSFKQFIWYYLKSKNLKRSEVYDRSEIQKQHFSKLLNTECNPSFTTAVQLAFGFSLTSDEASEFLMSAHFAFDGSDFDNEIKRLLDKKVKFTEANCELYEKFRRPLKDSKK